MADNTTINSMTGGDVISTDDIAGVKVQRVKVQHGVDGSATDVSTASPLPVTLANTGANATAVKTDGSAVTQPVSGTVTANAGTGTQAVSAASLPLPAGAATSAKQPALGTAGAASADVLSVQGVASMTALKTDGSAVTQPVSAAALPLPAGASTAAKQPALGTAGAASADVLTVQGVASMTALKTDSSATTQPVSGTVTANIGTAGTLALDATLTGGTQKTKLVDSGGTNVATVSAAGAVKTDGSAVTQPVSGTVSITANSAINNAQINGVTPLMGNGVTGTGSQRVTVASDNTPFPVKTDQTTHGTTDLVAADITKLGGTAVDVNSGNKSAGTQRVVLATDQPNLTTPLNVSGAIKDTLAAVGTLTLTLASLANSTVGVGRQSTLVDNTTNRYSSAQVSLKITAGTTPTANSLLYVYLIRSNNDATPIADDGAGTADAALTVINAPLLGTILVNSATSNLPYYGIFDTKPLGSLGPKWGIAVVNSSGVALNATGGNHVASFIGITQSVA